MESFNMTDAGSISPLPDVVHQALPVVAALGVISFVTTVSLFLRLCYLFVRWRREGQKEVNQLLILVFNLILADIQQATAFMLNAYWLQIDAIQVGTGTCWAQGWFVVTGDLASGVFTLAIALHAFADVVFSYRLKSRSFYISLAGCWIFVYFCAVIGIRLHGDDYFARAGPWCFINHKYDLSRLYLQYLWILIAEFGTVVLYMFTIWALTRRLRDSVVAPSKTVQQAKIAAKIMMAYPITYCICTLPIVSARLSIMAGNQPSYIGLCIGGAMMASNGWLDVLLYTLTRSSYIVQGEAPAPDAPILGTYSLPGQRFDYPSSLSQSSHQGSDYFGSWKQNSDYFDSSRPSSHDGPWGRVDLASERERIHQRASMSLRMMESERLRQGIVGTHLYEMPRFFERIYRPDSQIIPPRSPLTPSTPGSPLSMMTPGSPFSMTFPVEKE